MKQELKYFPDSETKQFLLHGFTYGFHSGISNLPAFSFHCKNLRSAISQPTIVAELIAKELKNGYLIGPYEKIPYNHYRINPIGIADSKYSDKKRLIVDLSAPHNDDMHPSLNSLIDKAEYSLKYVTIDDAIKAIKKFGRGSWLMKTDIKDAFKLIPLSSDWWPFHGIFWDNQFYFFTKLVFGSRSSPKIFDTFSSAVCWIAANNYGINPLLHLLDDFLAVQPAGPVPTEFMDTFLFVFHQLGIPLSPSKTIGPVHVLEYLGVILDTLLLQARLPKIKVDRIIGLMAEILNKKSVTKRELQQLLGHFNFACRVIVPARSFISHLISLTTKVKEQHHHVQLNKDSREELQMWFMFLQSWNGISFFHDDHFTDASSIQLYTDATPTSFGGYYGGKWFQGNFDLSISEGEETSMAFYELYPIVMACLLWGHTWERRRILFHCDNLATVDIISKGRSKVSSIMKLMRKMSLHAAKNNFTVHAQHLPGIQNIIADAISRYQMDKFRAVAPEAEPCPTPCLPMEDVLNI